MFCVSAYGHSQDWPGLCCVELFYVISLDCYSKGNFFTKINKYIYIYIMDFFFYPGVSKALTSCN